MKISAPTQVLFQIWRQVVDGFSGDQWYTFCIYHNITTAQQCCSSFLLLIHKLFAG